MVVAGCRSEQVVSLCGEIRKTLTAARFPWCKNPFRDFRDFCRIDDLDAVVVSTTEHTHAFATLPACRRHRYCESPHAGRSRVPDHY